MTQNNIIDESKNLLRNKKKNFQEILTKYGLVTVLFNFICNSDIDFDKHYISHKVYSQIIIHILLLSL